MPERAVWESFFDADEILTHLRLTPHCTNVVEFGCGYGTFTLPARRISGTVFALDIASTVMRIAQRRAASLQVLNIEFLNRDFGPRPDQCTRWAEKAGFTQSSGLIDLPPYHYGLVLHRG